MQQTADVVIIGAGVMGASIAFHLARRGAGRIVVVDKGGLCSGNTRKSGALVRMHYTYLPEIKLAVAALPTFQHWGDVVGGECGFTETGFLMVVGPGDVDKLKRNVDTLKACGVTTEVVMPARIRDLQPCANVDDIGAAAYEPHGGYADPVATTESFMRAAVHRGVTLHEGVKVDSVRIEHGRVTGVETSAGCIDAPVVVCAAGPWSKYLGDFPISAMRAQIAFFERADPVLKSQMVYIDTLTGMYSRPHGTDQSLGGIGAWGDTQVDDPDRYDQANDPDYIPEVRRRLAGRLPALAKAAYVRGHAGLYDITPDYRCIIDGNVGAQGYYVAAGFSGTGFKLSPTIGTVMSEMILDGRASSVDVSAFRLNRFTDGSPPIDDSAEYDLPADFGHRF